MVRFDTGGGTCVWLNRDRIEAIGTHPEGSMVILRCGQQLKIKGHTPDSMVFDLSDAWIPDGASDQQE